MHFHAFEQVKRCTTTRPRTQAGVDLYAIAKGLLKVGTPDAAAEWLAGYAKWCSDYEGFLKEREVVDGRPRYKHERLRKARRGLTKLCREGSCSPTSTRRSPPTAPSPRPTTA